MQGFLDYLCSMPLLPPLLIWHWIKQSFNGFHHDLGYLEWLSLWGRKYIQPSLGMSRALNRNLIPSQFPQKPCFQYALL